MMDTTPYGDEAYEVQMGRKKEKKHRGKNSNSILA
jgi:hypothetical protein